MDYTYRLMLQNAARSKSPACFQNAGPECTEIALEILLSITQFSLIIICHKLSSKIFGNVRVVNALRSALKRNPKLKLEVYIREDEPESSPFLTLLLLNRVNIKKAQITDNDNELDVFISDKKSYRQETDQTKKTADIVLNDPEAASSLIERLNLQGYSFS